MKRTRLGCLMAASLVALQPMVGAETGDARAGAEVLEARKCTVCHAVAGEGGSSAPDLGRRSRQPFTPAELAAQLWNHGPRMWRAMEERGLDVARLDASEVANLYAYFRALRYFDPPGDAARGKRVFRSRQCAHCHTLDRSREAALGPAVSDWPALGDPVSWIQDIWNHGSVMDPMMEAEGIARPKFDTQEMVDLLVYLRNLPGMPSVKPALRFGDPQTGERVFSQQGCKECHSAGGDASGKIDLVARRRDSATLTLLAVEMWNHRPRMAETARRKGLEIKRFAGDEMRDLTAYLEQQGFFEELGNSRRGAQLFREKQCSLCHAAGGEALRLPHSGSTVGTAEFAAAVWRHGPDMLTRMADRGIEWPEVSGGAVRDLTAFLSGR